MPEVQDLPDDARRDPIWQRSGGREHGRDGSRIPLPWKSHGPSFGFSGQGFAAEGSAAEDPSAESSSTGGSSVGQEQTPWLPQPEWFGTFAVSDQVARPSSTLSFYQAALRLRRLIEPASAFEWLDAGREDVLAFRRGDLVSVTVFGPDSFAWPSSWGVPVLRSDAAAEKAAAQPNTTVWLI